MRQGGWVLVLGTLALGLLILRKIRQGIGKRRDGATRKEDSEEVFFHRFEAAARSENPAGTYKAFVRWLDRFGPMGSTSSVRSFVTLANNEKLAREYEALEGVLYGGKDQSDGEAWSGRSLAAAVGQARKQLRPRRHGSQTLVDALPPLNP